MFLCSCCDSERPLPEVCELPCPCLVCKSCVVDQVDRYSKDVHGQQHGRLVVPCPSCSERLYPSHLQAIDRDKFTEWESRVATALLASQGLSQCPYLDCRAWIEILDPAKPGRKRPFPRSDETVIVIDNSDDDELANPKEAADRHFEQHRYRCSLCKRDFCAECNTKPYHKGYTCRLWQAPKCQYCSEKVLHRGDLRKPTQKPRDLRHITATAGLSIHWCIERSDFQFVYDRLRDVCSAEACRQKLKGACTKRLLCGHACHGIREESPCLRCIDPDCPGSCGASSGAGPSASGAPARPAPSDTCFFCWEPLPSAPCIELTCGHICHLHCSRQRLQSGYPGPGISFQFLYCPLCGNGGGGGRATTQMATGPVHLDHPALSKDIKPHLLLRQQVVDLAKMRLKVELEVAKEEDMQPGGAFDGRPADFALTKFVFFKCHKCRKPYFGGRRECGDNNEGGQQFNPEELLCGECSAATHGSQCPRHNNSYIEWKCRFCCNVASWFCFGTTHFCDPCHRNAYRVRTQPCNPATCTLKVPHPQPGQEFCLGCGLCRRADIV